MRFPQTRLTLVQRLAAGGREEDWRAFLQDYWGPVCRFALRWGAGDPAEAEEVASQTFEVLWQNRLLARWVSKRSARLRSLFCSVVRKILANRHRTKASRQWLHGEVSEFLDQLACQEEDPPDQAFYAAWVEDLVYRAVEVLAVDYYRQGKGDYVRVLYGRLCQRQKIAEVAEALQITNASVDNYFRHARDRLSQKLEGLLRRHVARYCPAAEVESEFAEEWERLGRYLAEHGGVEEAVRAAYAALDVIAAREHHKAAMTDALTRLTASIRISSDATSRRETT